MGNRAASSALCVTTIRMACCFCLQVEQQRGHGVGRRAIEIAGRLVAQQQPRPADQRARDRDALLLAARQLAGPMIDAMRRARPARRAHAHARRCRRRPGPPASARARSRAPCTAAAGSDPGTRTRSPCCGTPRARCGESVNGFLPSSVTVPVVGGSSAPRM